MSSPNGQWFVRRGTQVRGPFTSEQLEGLKKRGRVTDEDEVSTDRSNWLALSQFGVATGGDEPAGVAGGGNVGGYQLEQQPESVQSGNAGDGFAWFYAVADQQHGPAKTDILQRMLKSRELSMSSLVWREGYASWIPARDVPEFAQFGPAGDTGSVQTVGGGAVAEHSGPYRSADSVAIKSFFTLSIYLLVWYFESRRDMVSRGANIGSAWQQFIPLWNIYWYWTWCHGVGHVTQGRVPGPLLFCIWLLQIPLSLLTFGIVGAAWGWWVQKQLNLAAGSPA
ncbi:MAG: GYF domain-containing protein [Planctomycetaceae bacterium]